MGRLSKQAKRDEEMFNAASEWWVSVEESKARQAGTGPALGFWHADLPKVAVISGPGNLQEGTYGLLKLPGDHFPCWYLLTH